MIGIIFQQMDGIVIEVRISGNDLTVKNPQYGSGYFPIKTAFNYFKCMHEYPEIKDKSSWRDSMDEILKNKMRRFKTDLARFNYVKHEFQKQGYKYIAHQREGHRIRKDGNFL